ncbi:MAG: signal recognition particle protein [Thermodesulfobacteriota bacterium]|nr:signal recognition particle protein [Deltaproteobacteria bacterium]MDI6753193.1 signal recognition particle protein [Thermodesulfobacteriota bacterium]
MFDSLTNKLSSVFKKLRGHGKLSEQNINEAMKEVRLALLEADVNFKVVKDFMERIRSRAIGKEVLESLTPAQQVVKIVHEELISLMGGASNGLNLSYKPPIPIMLVGLQGSGKTTTVAKLGRFLKGKGRRPHLIPADVRRPAAIEQLQKLGEQMGIPVFNSNPQEKPLMICQKGLRWAEAENGDVLLIDTAGRLHIDEALMEELKEIQRALLPREVLLVADAMTGQDAVNVAQKFNEALDIHGVILTKLDGDARGGAALSIKAVTGKPIKFIGVGEKLDALEVFHPDRMASRILGMGDVLSLIEKAQETVDTQKAQELEKKLLKDTFTLEDFREQLQQIKKMGSMEQILSMIPGMGRLKLPKDLQGSEKELVKVEAIINSMTKDERRSPEILNGSRRLRIAKGSGTTVQDVNQLLKQYLQTKKMLRQFKRGGMRGIARGLFS